MKVVYYLAATIVAGLTSATASANSLDMTYAVLLVMALVSIAHLEMQIQHLPHSPAPKSPTRQNPRLPSLHNPLSKSIWAFASLAGLSAGAGIFLEIDKLLLLSSATLLVAACHMISPLAQHSRFYALVLMIVIIPLPAGLQAYLIAHVSPLEAKVATSVLNFFDVSAQRVGAQISIGDYVLSINRDCSSANLIAPALLGTTFASALGRVPLLTTVFWAFLALIVSVILNSLRIIALVLLTPILDAESFAAAHDLAGVAAMILAWLLPVMLGISPPPQPANPKRLGKTLMVLPFFILGHQTAHAIQPTYAHTSTAPKANARSLPNYHRGWVSQQEEITDAERRILNAQSIDRRSYRIRSGANRVTVTLMNFAHTKLAHAHDSRRCFEAQGWRVDVDQDTYLADGTRYLALTTYGARTRQRVFEFVFPSTDPKQPKQAARLQIVAPFETPHRVKLWMRSLAHRLHQGGVP